MAIDLNKISAFPRTVQVMFPDPTKAGKEKPEQIRVRFNYLDSEEYKDLFGFDAKGRVNYSQKEICERILDYVNPEDIVGADSPEIAIAACASTVAVQNAFIRDYSDCISGFDRKNSK